jgi:Holliday junction resolvasome RuvABC ATP-dependent DNA helicase subunit
MGVNIKITSARGGTSRRPGAILTNLRQGDVLFIDEVHRLSAW